MKKSILMMVCLTIFLISSSFTKAPDNTNNKNTKTTTNAITSTADDFLGVIASDQNYSTLAKVINVSGIEEELKTIGPFTIFAPINQGFASLTKKKLDNLVKDSTALTSVLQYHIVRGRYSKADIVKALSEGKDATTLTTLSGDVLTFKINADKDLEVIDERGRKAVFTAYNHLITRGVVHGVNNVLLPQ
ncbi:MAG: fasciclin domain-containing protein [Sphingobacteriaceae bacterium]